MHEFHAEIRKPSEIRTRRVKAQFSLLPPPLSRGVNVLALHGREAAAHLLDPPQIVSVFIHFIQTHHSIDCGPPGPKGDCGGQDRRGAASARPEPWPPRRGQAVSAENRRDPPRRQQRRQAKNRGCSERASAGGRGEQVALAREATERAVPRPECTLPECAGLQTQGRRQPPWAPRALSAPSSGWNPGRPVRAGL